MEWIDSGVAKIIVKELFLERVTANLQGWRFGCQQDGSVCS
jgi:hypothetical protein